MSVLHCDDARGERFLFGSAKEASKGIASSWIDGVRSFRVLKRDQAVCDQLQCHRPRVALFLSHRRLREVSTLLLGAILQQSGRRAIRHERAPAKYRAIFV